MATQGKDTLQRKIIARSSRSNLYKAKCDEEQLPNIQTKKSFIGWFVEPNSFAINGSFEFIDRKEFEEFIDWVDNRCSTSFIPNIQLGKKIVSQIGCPSMETLLRIELDIKNGRLSVLNLCIVK